MSHPYRLRLCLVALLIVPLGAVLGAGLQAHGQHNRSETQGHWKCGKCGGYLGEGLNPPSQCHHCKSKIINPRSQGTGRPQGQTSSKPSKEGTPLSSKAVLALIVLAVLGLAGLVMKASR